MPRGLWTDMQSHYICLSVRSPLASALGASRPGQTCNPIMFACLSGAPWLPRSAPVAKHYAILTASHRNAPPESSWGPRQCAPEVQEPAKVAPLPLQLLVPKLGVRAELANTAQQFLGPLLFYHRSGHIIIKMHTFSPISNLSLAIPFSCKHSY